jgi:acyl carrier protein
MSIKSTIISQMQQVAIEQQAKLAPLNDNLNLLESGLDSLGFAILVARLEDVLGVDPFTNSDEVTFPITFGDFVRNYEDAAKSSKIASGRAD